jgi:uncharacterized protein (TIGR03067 family)
MNRPRHLSPWFRTVGIALALTFFQRCTEAQAVPADESLAWDSPKMRDIETEWQELADTSAKTSGKIPGPPESFRENVKSLQVKLIGLRLSDRELQGLAGAPGPIPDGSFANDVVDCMLRSFLENGDRDSLVTMLSKRCPNRVVSAPIEIRLASWGYRIQDPILILGQAYSKCQDPQTCHNLAAAVRRGFAGLGIQGKDDADYVKNAMQWYEKEKDHLAVNTKYHRNDYHVPLEWYEKHPEYYDKYPTSVKREPLFENKSSSDESPRSDQEAEPEPGPEGVEGAPSTTAEKELANLQGTWKIIEDTSDGAPIPDEKVKGACLVFKSETLTETWPVLDKKGNEYHVRINGQQDPLAFDLIRMPEWSLKREQTTPLIYELQQETTPCIYAIKGDKLWICRPTPGARRRPTSFRAARGSHESLIVLKRVKE